MASKTAKTEPTKKKTAAKKSASPKKSAPAKKTTTKKAPTKKTAKPKKIVAEVSSVMPEEDRLKAEAEAEIKRINDVLKEAGVSKARIKTLKPVITNTAWMMVKLDDARTIIKTSNIVMPYDNGGGQKGIRENPMFRGYEALWKSYMAGMNKIIEALPEEYENRENEMERPKTMLEIVRERHKTS